MSATFEPSRTNLATSQRLKQKPRARESAGPSVSQGLEGDARGEGLRFAVVAARFNEVVTKRLVEGALEAFKEHGVPPSRVELVWVPGGMEVPWACKQLAQTKRYDAVVAIAAVIRGETSHFGHVCEALVSGVSQVSLACDVPVIFGSVTADSLQQALDRAGGKRGNRGREAAKAAIRMASLAQKLNR